MEQPVICVIVPVYKAEATLPRCIESVRAAADLGGRSKSRPQRRNL